MVEDGLKVRDDRNTTTAAAALGFEKKIVGIRDEELYGIGNAFITGIKKEIVLPACTGLMTAKTVSFYDNYRACGRYTRVPEARRRAKAVICSTHYKKRCSVEANY